MYVRLILSAIILIVANRMLESVPAPALLPSSHDRTGGNELFQRSAEGPIWDLGAHPTKNVALRRVRKALEILENERPKPVRLNPR